MKKNNAYTIARKITWIILAFGIAALSMAAIDHKQGVYVQSVLVDVVMLEGGANLVSPEDVLSELDNSFGPVTMMNIGQIDVDLIEETIERNPFMRKVDVFVDAHAVLHINVNQREPIIRVFDQNKQNFYLDITGVKIPVSEHFTPRVPIATGYIAPLKKTIIDKDSQKDHLVLYAVARKIYEDDFLRSLISQVYFDKEVGVILIPQLGAEEVVIGDDSKLDDKVERLKIFYKEGLPNVGWNTYKRLDLRFAGQVIGKKA